jgi:hypothetical protein
MDKGHYFFFEGQFSYNLVYLMGQGLYTKILSLSFDFFFFVNVSPLSSSKLNAHFSKTDGELMAHH